MLVLALMLVVGLIAAAVLSSPSGSGSSAVLYRERAEGVCPELVAFLDWWEKSGPFPVRVQPKGGLRTDAAEQAELYRLGYTRARTLAETPHGRGGAVDLAPADWAGVVVTAEDYAKFFRLGEEAERFGLRWGGEWKAAFPATKANPYGGDLPHIELPTWRELTFPGEVTV